MGKITTVAKHEFLVNFSRKQFQFFAFVIPAFILMLSIVFSIYSPTPPLEVLSGVNPEYWLFVVPSIIAVIFSLSIFLSANFLLQGIAIEKENRIMEVLISSISFKQLLIGKIIGLGFLGITQLFSWVAVTSIMLALSAPSLFSLALETVATPASLFFYGVFFLLGYVLYASLLAGIGAITETRGEAQQIGSLLTIFAWIPVSNILFLRTGVGGLASSVLTLFPFTAPVAAMIKVFTGTLSTYEAIMSILILISTIAIIVSATSRLFNVELIMYSRDFSAKDIFFFLLKRPNSNGPKI